MPDGNGFSTRPLVRAELGKVRKTCHEWGEFQTQREHRSWLKAQAKKGLIYAAAIVPAVAGSLTVWQLVSHLFGAN